MRLFKPNLDTLAPFIRIAIRYASAGLAGMSPMITEDAASTGITLIALGVLAILNETWYLKARQMDWSK